MPSPDNSRGFTLIELLVALVVASIVGIGVINVLTAQHQMYVRQNSGVLSTQNARAGLDMLVREMRNAAYDPRGSAGAGITRWTADSFGWTADLNADGDLVDAGESLLFFFQADSNALVRQEAGVNARLADNVSGLQFSYYSDAAGTVATGAAQIEQVGIDLTYDTPQGVGPGALETQVSLRNNIYQ